MNDPQPIDPFKSAKRIAVVNATLRPADITTLVSHISDSDAARLLDRHGGRIAAAMLAAGANAAIEILKSEGWT